jgi:cytochrome c556
MPFRRAAAALMLVVSGCVGLAGVSFAQAPGKAEQALKYRKSLYQVIAWNFGPMSAMAQGKVPYDAKQFALRAERVAAVAPMLSEAYPAESQGVSGSKLKPAMWENRADFDAKLQDMIDASARLAVAARTGDFAKSKEAFFATGNTCKACHDRYKED